MNCPPLIMKKLHALIAAACLLTGFAQAALPAEPTLEQYNKFQKGDVKAVTEYVGAPAILISVYKREIVQMEGQNSLRKYAILTHGRVVASSAPGILFGRAVCHVEIREGDKEVKSILPAKGELLYIVAPDKVQTNFATEEIVLDDSFIDVPLEGSQKDYQMARSGAAARGYGESAQ